MRIDAVSVCTGYADFLAETLPVNLPHLDRLVVVTSPDDRETQAVCRRYGVECRPTGLMTARGAKFAKARGIDYGLAYLAASDWVLHFDADVAFPPDMRRALQARHLDPKAIYGVDRADCKSYDDWRAHRAGDRFQQLHGFLVQPPPFRLGSRLSLPAYEGYVPIGFFQLWHASAGRRYPTAQHDGAEHTDVLHAIQWDAADRHLIPDFFVTHLDTSTSGSWGANWKGRTTPRFGPPPAAGKPSRSY